MDELFLHYVMWADGYSIDTLMMSSSYIIFRGKTKYVSCTSVCSTSTRVISGYGIVFMLYADVIKSVSTSAFRLLLADGLTAQ
jgi:hypothetical protein